MTLLSHGHRELLLFMLNELNFTIKNRKETVKVRGGYIWSLLYFVILKINKLFFFCTR